MRRDNDYLRDLLFSIEDDQDWVVVVVQHLSMSEEENKKYYHVQLLADAGLVTSVGQYAYRLTSSGHDFLDAIRSDTVWRKTKDGASKIGGATIGMIKDLAIAYIKQEAAEKLGIKL